MPSRSCFTDLSGRRNYSTGRNKKSLRSQEGATLKMCGFWANSWKTHFFFCQKSFLFVNLPLYRGLRTAPPSNLYVSDVGFRNLGVSVRTSRLWRIFWNKTLMLFRTRVANSFEESPHRPGKYCQKMAERQSICVQAISSHRCSIWP